MFSYLQGLVNRREESGGGDTERPETNEKSKLSADELRRLRTEKLNSNPVSPGTFTSTVKEEFTEHLSPPQLGPGAASASSPIEEKSPSSASSPQLQRKPPSELADTPSKQARVDILSLNASVALESVLQVTLRRSAASGTTRYVGPDDSVGGEELFLNSNNIGERICERLMSEQEYGGAVGYLGACFKRLVAKSSADSSRVREELNSCRRQVISFAASALTEKDMFGENSAHSARDLYQFLAQETTLVGSLAPLFLQELTEELIGLDCLDQVINEVIGVILERLFQSSPMGRSVVDSNCLEPTQVLVLLCRSEKRLAALVALSSAFLAEKSRLEKRPPPFATRQHLPPHMVAMLGTAGAAIEHTTILGRILSVSPDPFDPQVQKMFSEAHRTTRSVIEGHFQLLRGKMKEAQAAATEILLSLLKAGGSSKNAAMKWLEDAIFWNAEAQKSHPSQLVAASSGFLINFGAVMIALCKPIFTDDEKLKKVDWAYFLQPSDSGKIFPPDSTKLAALEAGSGNSNAKITFATQSIMMCWRVLHLGFAQRCDGYHGILRGLSHFHAGLQTNEPNAIHYLVLKMCSDVVLLEPELVSNVACFCAAAAQTLLSALVCTPSIHSNSWLVNIRDESTSQLLSALPEHLVEDIMVMLHFIAKTEPSKLTTSKSLEPVLSLILFFLRRPWSVQSPHLRARFSEVLFQVFLPHNLRGKGDLWSQATPVDGPHEILLSTLPEAQAFLAPALLLLYGDVERTGFYEKLGYRRSIMILLKHLWTLPTHRAAFRGIAAITESTTEASETDNDGVGYFIRFANGLINETNALIAMTLDKLSEIRKIQLLMTNAAEWSALGDDGREQQVSRLQASENEVRGAAGLCLETLDMLGYLTSDEFIRIPFLRDQILPRFTSLLLSVLNKLVGAKSLEIKVENMDSYNFDPKSMLRCVCQAMINFSQHEEFWKRLATDGFFGDGKSLRKAVNTATRLRLFSQVELESFRKLFENAMLAKSSLMDLDSIQGEAPDEFLDPIMQTLMSDPVLLPTSGNIVDRSTISQHLLNDEKDPFNRLPLKISAVVPQTDLKKRIDDWLSSMIEARRKAAADQMMQQEDDSNLDGIL